MKNKLDQHFSKKLKDLEIEPSKRAHLLFKKEVNKRNNNWKYFTAAASILLISSIIYLNYEIDANNETAHSLEEIIPDLQQHISESTVEEVQIDISTPVIKQQWTQTPLTDSSPIIEVSTTPSEEVEALRKKIQVSKLNPKTNLETNLIDYTLVDVLQEKIQIPELYKEEESFEIENKKLLTKIIEEVKYVANGEKPDLDRAGILPAATVSINKNGLIAHEKQQFKESVNRIKDFLSK